MDIESGQFDDADNEQPISTTQSKADCIESTMNLFKGKMDSTNGYHGDDFDDDEEDDDDDDDYLDWDDDSGGMLKPVTSSNSRSAPNQQQKTAGPLQPSEKVMRKYIDKINVEKYTGPQLTSSASSALTSKGKQQDHMRLRGKDKSDRATAEQVMDPRTRMILFKMISRGVITEVNGCISTGKEANVYHATAKDGSDKAIKVYKTSILIFKDRDKYVSGEFRFRHGYCKHNPRKMVRTWAEKEMRNLTRLHQAGVPCPEPILLRSHVLVMDFIGTEGWPAPLLKDSEVSESKARELYLQCIQILRSLYHDCRLIHADFSEFNLLVHEGSLYVIDVSQSVEHDHPHALEFLRKDCTNVTEYFRKKGVSTLTVKELFDFVTDVTITADNLDQYLDKCMKLTAGRTAEDVTEEDKVNEEVFKNVFIPRTLDQVVDFERDFYRQKKGDETELLYSKLTGLTTDLSGSQQMPTILQDTANDPSSTKDTRLTEDTQDTQSVVTESVNEEEQEDTNSESDENASENEDNSDCENKKEKTKLFIRDRDESPNSRKERKRIVKEAQKEKRLTKIPKHVKRRKEKVGKQKK
ncbi:serine/threonine-protein kinase RIO1-like [Dreissena polymorpha]|uniref:Serine/threonine-protein kinase RIO1 n=1 Tax=Dreissena polymorpha TaxID=45954 RepID=A0A9D4CXL2_DREPO|nr:serine/threonine-protein kinase RIO1-like [Dreissena polymorpha]KAH3734195.1 hypothetical protein DPMN_040635 [Dreissena polymorpha]